VGGKSRERGPHNDTDERPREVRGIPWPDKRKKLGALVGGGGGQGQILWMRTKGTKSVGMKAKSTTSQRKKRNFSKAMSMRGWANNMILTHQVQRAGTVDLHGGMGNGKSVAIKLRSEVKKKGRRGREVEKDGAKGRTESGSYLERVKKGGH